MIHRMNLIWVLLWQNFTPRDRQDRLRLMWVFLEPLGGLAVLMLIFIIIGRSPPYGRSFALFLTTGLVMLHVYSKGNDLVMRAIDGLKSELRLPSIGMFDAAIAQLLFVLIVTFIYLPGLLYGIYYVTGARTWPHNWQYIFEAVFWASILAFGVGLLRGYCKCFYPGVDRIYAIFSRALVFISGVFYVPSFLPPQLRDALYLNPIVHLVEILRLGFYYDYPTTVYDPIYIGTFALGTLTLGVALLWRNRAVVMG